MRPRVRVGPFFDSLCPCLQIAMTSSRLRSTDRLGKHPVVDSIMFPSITSSSIWLILCCLTLSASALHSLSLFNASSNALITKCVYGNAWTKPYWPAWVSMNYQSILRHLLAVYARPTQGQVFEFLPVGAPQTSAAIPAVRTPFKLVRGMLPTLQHESTHLLPSISHPAPNPKRKEEKKGKDEPKEPLFR